jgi:hypothetical protein
MASFQEEFDKRLRRVCGVTDDSLRVSYWEYVHDSGWSGHPYDTNHGASYEIEVSVEVDRKTHNIIHKKFTSLGELMSKMDEVEL